MGYPEITQLGSRVGSRCGYSGPVIPDMVWKTGKEERYGSKVKLLISKDRISTCGDTGSHLETEL